MDNTPIFSNADGENQEGSEFADSEPTLVEQDTQNKEIPAPVEESPEILASIQESPEIPAPIEEFPSLPPSEEAAEQEFV